VKMRYSDIERRDAIPFVDNAVNPPVVSNSISRNVYQRWRLIPSR
jgi:hypothetical protein